MVTALMDDLRLPASELARLAKVSRSTASEHLGRLVESGLLATERCGRHTYYRIADPQVAHALEALAVLAPKRKPNSLNSVRRQDELARARLCYDHLAGRLGVLITDSLYRQGLLREEAGVMQVNSTDWDTRPPLGVTCGDVTNRRRPLVRGCVDWTDRRHHLAGSLGAALTDRMFELGWIRRRRDNERVISLTETGRDGVRAAFDFGDSTMETVTTG